MAAQLPLPQLSGRLPNPPADITQLTDNGGQTSAVDGNHNRNDRNHNSSVISEAAQAQRDIRLLTSLFKKRVNWYKFVHCENKELGKEISPSQRKRAWKRLCDLYMKLNDDRDIASCLMDPDGVN